MACTGLFGAGAGSFIAPPDLNKNFTLSSAHIVVIDEQVEQLLLDFEVLIDLVKVRHHLIVCTYHAFNEAV